VLRQQHILSAMVTGTATKTPNFHSNPREAPSFSLARLLLAPCTGFPDDGFGRDIPA
jgi:hypothetical protein